MVLSLKPLQHQVIVVTGGSSGIGLATAMLAAQHGAAVALLARSLGTMDRAVEMIEADGGRAIAVRTDVGMEREVVCAARAVVERFGRIDTWVNAAGVSIYGRVDEVCNDDSRRLFDTNYWGVVYGSLAALPHLKRGGGALVTLVSEACDSALAWQAMYSASQHAIKGFIDALRLELEAVAAPVAVTMVQPGRVDTKLCEHAAQYLVPHVPAWSPRIDPFTVAQAVLRAATLPTQHVRVEARSSAEALTKILLAQVARSVAAGPGGPLPKRRRRHEGVLYTATELTAQGDTSPAQ